MSIIYDALKKLQKDIERNSQKKSKRDPEEDAENSPAVKISSFGFSSDTAILPPPRIPKSLLEVSPSGAQQRSAPSLAGGQSNFPNSTITTALNLLNQKNEKISIILFGVTCAILIFSIGFMFWTMHSSSAQTEPTKVATKKPAAEPIALQGIMTRDDKQVALINDEIYEVGESVKGRKIIDIALDNVQILDHRKVKTLYVKKKP